MARDSIRNTIVEEGPIKQQQTNSNLRMQFLHKKIPNKGEKKSDQRRMCKLPLDKRIELTEQSEQFQISMILRYVILPLTGTFPERR